MPELPCCLTAIPPTELVVTGGVDVWRIFWFVGPFHCAAAAYCYIVPVTRSDQLLTDLRLLAHM